MLSGEKDPQSPKEAWANRGSPQDLNESILSTVDEDEEWQDSGLMCVWWGSMWSDVCGGGEYVV